MSWLDWIPQILGAADLYKNRGDASLPDAPAAYDPLDIINASKDLAFFDINTPFGSTTWAEGEDGRMTQNQNINPALQGAIDRVMGRAGTPTQVQENAGMTSLANALLQKRMARNGQDFNGGFGARPNTNAAPQGSSPGHSTPPPQGQGPSVNPGAPGFETGGVAPGQPGSPQNPVMGGGGNPYTGGQGGFGYGGFGLPMPAGGSYAGGGSPSSGLANAGRLPLSTPGGFDAANSAGGIGSLLSALTGIPGLNRAASSIGDRYIDRHTNMSPLNPDDPWGDQAYQDNADATFGFGRDEPATSSPIGSGGINPFISGYRSAAPWRKRSK